MHQKGHRSTLGDRYIFHEEGYAMKKIALGGVLSAIGVAGTAHEAIYSSARSGLIQAEDRPEFL